VGNFVGISKKIAHAGAGSHDDPQATLAGRATTRIDGVLGQVARLRPRLLCRVTCIAQHCFRLPNPRRGNLGCILNHLSGLAGPDGVALDAAPSLIVSVCGSR